ncbi:MAG TPA: hypothetical protein VFX12_14560 [Vicinamibacterales bacterium]|nr:hypothetical protein [Vicinamibacterales bacterium]
MNINRVHVGFGTLVLLAGVAGATGSLRAARTPQAARPALSGPAASVRAATVPVSPRTSAPVAPIPFDQIGSVAAKQYSGDGLSVSRTRDGATLASRFQKLEAEITSKGLSLASTEKRGGHLRLSAAFWRRGGTVTTLPAGGHVAIERDRVRFVREGLVEEFGTSIDGVRQDFIVDASRADEGPLELELALSGARAEASAAGATLTYDGSNRALAYGRLRVTDASGKPLAASLRVIDTHRLIVRVEDARAAYPVRIDPTFSDADWVSLNPGIPGTNGEVDAIAVDGIGNVYVGGHFTGVGSVPANNVAKWDGNAWSALGAGVNSNVFALAVSGTEVYAGGVFTMAGAVAANYVARWDGNAWSPLGTGMDSVLYALAVTGTTVYAGGYFTMAGGVAADHIAKWNGSGWSALGVGTNDPVYALAASGSDLYAGGPFTTAGGIAANHVAKWDGNAWSVLGTGTNDTVRALAVSGTDVYAGGAFVTAGGLTAKYIAKWNGSGWSALGAGMNYQVLALAVSGTDVYAGGGFTMAGGVAANYVAKWDGSGWSALGVGLNNVVYALAVSGADVYAGGAFSTAGGVVADDVAKWNGSDWSALGGGGGMNDYVSALAVSGTDLYAGGAFTTAGGVAANYVAKWNGSQWSALGNGMNAFVNALAVSGTDVYAGGGFTMAGGVAAKYVAKWNGSEWSALGAGMNDEVFALAVSGTDVYAGGYFTTADGVPAKFVAKWNGSEWSGLGTGMNADVYALAVSGTDLYAGGDFSEAGGVTANCVAKWDGSTWAPLGGGLQSQLFPIAYALAVSGTDVYVGGLFDAAGGVSANGIAKWDGSGWSALGDGLERVSSLAVSGSDVYAGEYPYTTGGDPSTAGADVAKWDGSSWSALGTGLRGASAFAMAADSAGHLWIGGNFFFAGTTVSPYIAQANLPDGADGGTLTARVVSLYPVTGAQAGQTSRLWVHVENDGTQAIPGDGVVWINVTGPNGSRAAVMATPGAPAGLSNPWVGSPSVAGLASGTSQWYSFDWAIPASEPGGPYGYAAQVWATKNGVNQAISPMSGTQTFTVAPPPLPVAAKVLSGFAVPATSPGSTATLWAYVQSIGTDPLPAGSKVWFEVIGGGTSTWVGATGVSGLAAGASQWYAYDWVVPNGAAPGAFSYVAQVWSGGAISPLGPAVAFTITPGPTASVDAVWPVNNAASGGTAVLWAKVRNTGAASLPAGAKVWFFVDGPGWTGDHWVGSADVQGLAAGASNWYAFTWPIGSREGTFYYWAQVWSTGAISGWSAGQSFVVASVSSVKGTAAVGRR